MKMEVSFVFAKPEEAHLLSEFRQKVWATTYRGIYPDKLIDEFDFDFHDSRNLQWINSEEYSVFFITADGEKAGYLIAPAHIEGMLHYGQKLDMGVAHIF